MYDARIGDPDEPTPEESSAEAAAERRRLTTYLLTAPPMTLLGSLVAGRQHGLWLPSERRGEQPELVIATSVRPPRTVTPSTRGGVRWRRRTVPFSDRVVVNGLPMTSLERTWIDLAEHLSLLDLVAAGDSVLRAGGTLDGLRAQVRAARRRRGVVRAREAVTLLNPRSESRPESHLRCILVLGGLPEPAVNIDICNDFGEWLARPDLHYRRARLTLEYNGAEHAKKRRTRRDITRSLDIERADWREVVFGPGEVFGQPEVVLTHVRALLDLREPGWRARMKPRPAPHSWS